MSSSAHESQSQPDLSALLSALQLLTQGAPSSVQPPLQSQHLQSQQLQKQHQQPFAGLPADFSSSSSSSSLLGGPLHGGASMFAAAPAASLFGGAGHLPQSQQPQPNHQASFAASGDHAATAHSNSNAASSESHANSSANASTNGTAAALSASALKRLSVTANRSVEGTFGGGAVGRPRKNYAKAYARADSLQQLQQLLCPSKEVLGTWSVCRQ
jgi:hypothetical protein